MFQRLKDAIAFESEFSRWEKFSQIRTLLTGNRVAEMFGQSASYGKGIDVHLLRELFERLRPEAIKSGKQSGLSSQHALMRFLCTLGDAYLKESGLEAPPKELLFPLTVIVPIYEGTSPLIPDRWSLWLTDELDQSRKYFEEQRSAAPLIARARHEAEKLLAPHSTALDTLPFPNELLQLWRYIPNQQQQTERWISSACGLPLKETMAWLRVLQSRGVVTILGTALAEPKYWKTPITTLREAARHLRDKLDTYA